MTAPATTAARPNATHLTVARLPSAQPTMPPRAVALLARARSLGAQAQLVNPIVAQAYLRRATQLRHEAWAQAGRPVPIRSDDSPAAA